MCTVTCVFNHAGTVQVYICYINLCRDVGVLLPVAVAVVGVDVVRAGHAVHRLKHHPTMVVGDHVGVPIRRIIGKCNQKGLILDRKVG